MSAIDYSPAAAPLQHGQLAVIPTDTIYGLVASARSPQAAEWLYLLRGRDANKPCILLVADVADLHEFGIELTPPVADHLRDYWPGPISVVLPCPDLDNRWEYLHRGTRTLAVRLPDRPALRELLRQTGPLLAPSANLAGQPPAATIEEARSYFGDAVAAYIDAGRFTGQPSRLIALDDAGRSTILRP